MENNIRFGETVIGGIIERSGMNMSAIKKKTGYDVKTINNWRSGASCPKLRECNEFSSSLNVSPLKFYMGYAYKEIMDASDSDPSVENLRKLLVKFFQCTTEQEILQVKHLVSSPEWLFLRESFLEDAHLPMWGRVLSTHHLIALYNASIRDGEFDHSGELPDMELVSFAMSKGKDAFTDGSPSYGVPSIYTNDVQWCSLFGHELSKAKEKAGLSNEYIAGSLNRTTSTISSWLSGKKEPNFYIGAEFFKICNQDPFRPMYSLVYPAACNMDAPEMSESRSFVIDFFNAASERDLRVFNYMIFGNHGSSWHSMLQKYSVGARIPERYKIYMCGIISSMYSLARDADIIVCKDDILPDTSIINDVESNFSRLIQNIAKTPQA